MILKEAVVVVTGGASGLGLAMVTYFSELGAKVVVVDLDEVALSKLPEGIERYLLDVTCLDDAKTTVKCIIEKHNRINVLVNNAGVIHSEPMVNIMNPTEMMHDYSRFCESISVNMHSVFIMTSTVVEQMVLSRTKGCVVNISSISARGNEGQTAYSAAKAGVNAMTVTWSKELGLFGIRCNAVEPGFIDTNSTQSALNESILKHLTSNTPLRRLGKVEEVAEAVASLICNDFINGAILKVNGGLSI